MRARIVKLSVPVTAIGLLFAAAAVPGQESATDTSRSSPAADHHPRGKLPLMPGKVARASGKLLIRGYSWDFGHVPQDARVSHRFTVENAGDDTLFLERMEPT